MTFSNETYDTIVDVLESALENATELADFYGSGDLDDDFTEIVETLRFSIGLYQSALNEFQDKARNWRTSTP